ncbi:unnamed protein product [Allacma fusca]|uniref:CNNM transmembrane domain-containing protein n=1 Tax=Allacma fusca TaxID=39272 RepID=A0A8J2NXC7_9HEXA|nr:unnamed protein product [Allacma fusca]
MMVKLQQVRVAILKGIAVSLIGIFFLLPAASTHALASSQDHNISTIPPKLSPQSDILNSGNNSFDLKHLNPQIVSVSSDTHQVGSSNSRTAYSVLPTGSEIFEDVSSNGSVGTGPLSSHQLVMTLSSKTQPSKDEQDPTTTNSLLSLSSSMTHGVSLSPVPIPSVSSDNLENRTATVRGIRIEEAKKAVTYENKGVSVILADSVAVLRLFGDRFTRHTIVRFVTEMGSRGSDCDDVTSTRSFSIYKSDLTPHSALANIQLPPLDVGEEVFYICVRENNTDMPWVHQGTDQWIQLKSFESILPVWAHIVILIVLLCLSGLFSGLNLGLMAIDRTEIQIIVNTGTEKERRYAKKIQPLRDNGNYLLCSLLLGNVLVNSTLTILLDDLTTGLVAVLSSTLGIVILGEIVPQAFCSRHGLAVGAQTIWLTKFFMAITFPISYPVSVLLDKVLGEEIGNVYNRERLKELIKVTHQYNDLEKDEVNIIAGALEMKQKTVGHIMTKLENVFMLPIEAVLDFDTVSEIMSQGYSRIPIYTGTRSNVVSLLYTKDLAFVDPDDKMPLRTICEFYNNPCNYVFESTTLDVIFREFKQGVRGHMAFVQKIHTGGKEDPYYEIVGLVTMEDVIEELIQAEINDETDVWDINRRRRSRATANVNSELALIRWKSEGIHVSPQLALAAFQYLSTSIEQFNEQRISKTILQRLLNQNLFFHIKIKNRDTMKSDPATIIYERGKPADYFVLILEGRVQAEMGRESLQFESGPFTFFGTQSLNQNIGVGEAPSTPTEIRKSGHYNAANLETLLYSTFVPDYTVRAVTDVTFLRISRSIYMAAKQATLLERTFTLGDTHAQNRVGDNFEEQIDKMMNTGKGKIPNVPNTIDQDNYNYFRRVNSYKPDNLTKRGSEIFSEIILKPSLLISDFDKEDPPSTKRNGSLMPRKLSGMSSITMPVDNVPNNLDSPSRPDSPSGGDATSDKNKDDMCEL